MVGKNENQVLPEVQLSVLKQASMRNKDDHIPKYLGRNLESCEA